MLRDTHERAAHESGSRWRWFNKAGATLGYIIPFASSAAALTNTAHPEIGAAIEPISHTSSVSASYSIGAVTMIATTEVANHLQEKGHAKAAARLKRCGQVAAFATSVFYQWAAESGTFPVMGTSDKRDFMYGIVATLPGILFGEYVARNGLVDPPDSDHFEGGETWQLELPGGEHKAPAF